MHLNYHTWVTLFSANNDLKVTCHEIRTFDTVKKIGVKSINNRLFVSIMKILSSMYLRLLKNMSLILYKILFACIFTLFYSILY